MRHTSTMQLSCQQTRWVVSAHSCPCPHVLQRAVLQNATLCALFPDSCKEELHNAPQPSQAPPPSINPQGTYLYTGQREQEHSSRCGCSVVLLLGCWLRLWLGLWLLLALLCTSSCIQLMTHHRHHIQDIIHEAAHDDDAWLVNREHDLRGHPCRCRCC